VCPIDYGELGVSSCLRPIVCLIVYDSETQKWGGVYKRWAAERQDKTDIFVSSKTQDSTVTIMDPYMRFADIFLSTCHIHILELDFKRPTVTSQWHCVQTSVYPFTAVTGVERLISNCTLTDPPPTTAPQPQFCLTNPERKEFIFFFII